MGPIPDLWGRVLSAWLPYLIGAAGAGAGWLARWLWRRHADAQATEAAWRDKIEAMIAGLDERSAQRDELITRAQHVTMRTTLIHNANKYLEQGWATPEEKQGWFEMYVAYSDLGLNGFMAHYWARLEELPERQLEDVMRDATRLE